LDNEGYPSQGEEKMIKRNMASILLITVLLLPSCGGLILNDTNNTNVIYPGQLNEYDDWLISLDGGEWRNGTLIVNITISNYADRRYFSSVALFSGFGVSSPYSLVAVDSTNKVAYPIKENYPLSYCFYQGKEFYPKESLSGKLTYELSEYSGDTSIYIVQNSRKRKKMFDVGSPN